jgi:dienelactone hydrolase/Fe-S cluster assembly iron-binding protein IscA
MSIEFSCPACAKPYRVKDELAGKTARCVCGQRIVVPTPPVEPTIELPVLEVLEPTSQPTPNLTASTKSRSNLSKRAPLPRGYRALAPLSRWLDTTESILAKIAIGAIAGAFVGAAGLAHDKGNIAKNASNWMLVTIGGAAAGVLAASILVGVEAVRNRANAGRRIPFVVRLLFASGWLSAFLWIVLAFGGAILYAYVDSALFIGGPPAITAPNNAPAVVKNLLEDRANFTTQLIPNSYKPDGPADTPPRTAFSTVHYKSAVGDLVAYVTPDPADGQRHPAVLWAHGGFGGIDGNFWISAPWENDQSARAFRDARIVLMCPSWRGENDNPGKFELFFGEVNDLLAARDYLASLPYVDPQRIYLAGHSTGGTLALLAATATDKFRAVFSFGGAPDLETVVSNGKGYGNTPFNYRSQPEVSLRSAINYTRAIRTPTFYFEGSDSAYVKDAREMDKLAKVENVPFTACIIYGGNHFNILRAITTNVAMQIVADTGPQCSIDINEQLANQWFQQARAAYKRQRKEVVKDLPLVELTPAAVSYVKERFRAAGLDTNRHCLRVLADDSGISVKVELVYAGVDYATVQQDGIVIQIPKPSLETLQGGIIDYDEQASDFVFNDRASTLIK